MLATMKACLCSHRYLVSILSHTPSWCLPHAPSLPSTTTLNEASIIYPFLTFSEIYPLFLHPSRPASVPPPSHLSINLTSASFSTFSSLLHFFIRHNFLFPFLPSSHPLLSFLPPSRPAWVPSRPKPVINTSSLASFASSFTFLFRKNNQRLTGTSHRLAVSLFHRSFLLSSPPFSLPTIQPSYTLSHPQQTLLFTSPYVIYITPRFLS